jgi:hypothetical protein
MILDLRTPAAGTLGSFPFLMPVFEPATSNTLCTNRPTPPFWHICPR